MNPWDLDALYRQEAPKLLRLFGRKVGVDEAPDLVQESFTRFANRGSDRPPVENGPGFLMRIAVNLVRNPAEVARRERRRAHLSFDEAHHRATDPHAGLEARDMLARLERAVARLKPRTREIFLAHRVEGLSYGEIAARTGLSVKGVEKQMSKALAELARMVDR